MQNFVQCWAILGDDSDMNKTFQCTIFLNYCCAKNCAIIGEKGCNTGDVDYKKNLLHSIIYIVQFCEQYSSWNDLVCRSSGNPYPFASFTHLSYTRDMTWISHLEKFMTSYTRDMTWSHGYPKCK